MDWVTIDFEASCLPRHGRSYPIEVGICGPLGACSWLIKPAPEWRLWDWTEQAFGLHGISRERLDAQGLEPAAVVAEVRRAIGPARVVADSPIDREWWHTLQAAAMPRDAAAPIAIGQIDEVFSEWGATTEEIEAARQRADRLCPERHRAGADARWLYTLILAVSEQNDTGSRQFPEWTSRDAYVRGLARPETAKVFPD